MSTQSSRTLGSIVLEDFKIRIGKERITILPMVISIASAARQKYGSLVDYDDVVAEALLGLADARRKYNGKIKFSTYAFYRIHGAVTDIVRREAANAKKHVLMGSEFFVNKHVSNDVESRLAFRQQYEQAVEVIQRELKPKDSTVLEMLYLSSRSETELAQLLQCSIGSVSKAKTAALAAARMRMNKRGHYAMVE